MLAGFKGLALLFMIKDKSSFVVLITGASSGIGRSTAMVMANHGATVFGVGRKEEELKALLDANVLIGYAIADLSLEDECLRVVNSAVDSLGGLTTVAAFSCIA
jgi:NADP-dependent 3-hydroxy acid dehydrogenase YdfG